MVEVCNCGKGKFITVFYTTLYPHLCWPFLFSSPIFPFYRNYLPLALQEEMLSLPSLPLALALSYYKSLSLWLPSSVIQLLMHYCDCPSSHPVASRHREAARIFVILWKLLTFFLCGRSMWPYETFVVTFSLLSETKWRGTSWSILPWRSPAERLHRSCTS